MSRALRVRVAFEIVVQHFSCQTLKNSQTEIYELVRERYDSINAYVGPVPERDDVKKALTYLNHFGLVENPERRCWHIKSVDDMCDWLHMVHNGNIENDDQDFTVSIAFEIIIHDFSDDTNLRSTKKIEEHVFNVHKKQGGLPPEPLKDPLVNRTLRFLNYFGFAKKAKPDKKPEGHTGEDYWRIKSVENVLPTVF